MTRYSGTAGSVGVLSVGAGDMKLSFDKSNPAERIRAARVVADMIRRGYALLIEVDVAGQKTFTRALSFDENVCEYIVADFDPMAIAAPDQKEADHGQDTAPNPVVEDEAPRPKRGYTKRRVAAETAVAVAVGRTAGG